MIPRFGFALLLALVVLVAVPFGANRMWAWGLLAIVVGIAMLSMAIAAAANPANLALAWRHYRLLAVGYLVVLAWMLVQAWTGMPEFLHHPLWREAAGALGTPVRGAISLDPAASLSEASKFIAYGGVFWLALQFAASDHSARVIFWAVLFAAFANAVYGLIVQFSGGDTILWFKRWSYQGSVIGTFVNRNHFGAFCGLGLLVGFGYLLEELRRVSAGLSLRTLAGLLRVSENLSARLILLCIIVLTLGLSVILSGSRGALTATGIGLTAFLAGASLSNRISATRVLRFGIVLLGAALVAVAINGTVTLERLSAVGANMHQRLALYKATLTAIADRPLLGTGGGTFESVFLAYRPEAMWSALRRYDYAHNTYLEFGLEHGLVALAIMLFLAVWLMRRLIKGARTRRHNDVFPGVGIGATALVASHALIDFSLEIPAVAVAYLVITAVAYTQSIPHRERGPMPRARIPDSPHHAGAETS